MKRSIDSVDGLDDKGQEAKIPNQQPESDMASSYRDEGQHAEYAQVSQTALATSFAQQESVLTAEQIESIKGFDKEGVGIVLDKIALDAWEDYPEALNAISQELANFTKEELDCLHRIFVCYFEDALGKNVSGEYTDEVIMMDKIGERLGI